MNTEIIRMMNEVKAKAIDDLIAPIKPVFTKINDSIKKNVKEIGLILKCLYVAIMVSCCNSFYTALITTVIMLFVSAIVKSVYYYKNKMSETGIPVREKRFTKLDANGYIEVDENRKLEMIQYLYELENYIEMHKKS